MTAGSAKGKEPQSPVAYAAGRPLPWINWAGNQYCYPSVRASPQSEAELIDTLRKARGVVRAVGAGHSFTAVVPTDDTLISMDLLSGIARHDPATLQAEVWAGTRLHDLGPLLDACGQAMPNLPDMDYLSVGGAIANCAHATGIRFPSLSAQVSGLTLATPSGELLACDREHHREIFEAARSSLGVLGIATRLRLQNQAPYRLVETNRVEKTEEVLEDLAHRLAQHRHFEFLPLPNCPLCATVTTDLAGAGDVARGQDDPQAAQTLRQVFDAVHWIPWLGPAAYETLLRLALAGEAETVRVGPSHEVFAHVRIIRFREMEYTVPAEAGPACVREILGTIRERGLPVCFPLEVRFVQGDDLWLSMFAGRDGCAISVHQFGDQDHRAYFEQIEPIFWKYEGRPHWGKLHSLDAPRLAGLYPGRWKDFLEVRSALDPQGRMLNPYLRRILGVA